VGVLGGVILGVLLEVAEVTRDLDLRGDVHAGRRLELVELGAQRLEALGGHLVGRGHGE
jgi:hypothetical protein